jgi:hypothetical protein
MRIRKWSLFAALAGAMPFIACGSEPSEVTKSDGTGGSSQTGGRAGPLLSRPGERRVGVPFPAAEIRAREVAPAEQADRRKAGEKAARATRAATLVTRAVVRRDPVAQVRVGRLARPGVVTMGAPT